ncbi:MAG: AAA family ATPase, partial [Planctomycetota bacterium]
MKVLRVRVQCFQGIESADIEFGPGLNILYGPNDLGKTSIASAVRAALLLRASAKAGDAHAPWHRDASPEVELTLKTDDDRVWRVRKVFNSTGSGWAELSESNDGQTFRVDASGREAEGKLQRMLRWGIPEPGGKRGASGIPVSFLSSVLLADQANVGDILTKSLADDPDESGRLRLNEALQALAQDPQLKAALDRAQQEVDRFYSATGKKRRGQSSPFTTVANEVKELQADERRLREVVDKASAAEREVESLRDQVREQTDRVDEARDALDLASKRAEQHVAVLAAEQALAAARADLLAVAELEQRADKKAEEIRTCRERLAEAEVQAADEAAKLEAVEAHRDEARARLDRAQG